MRDDGFFRLRLSKRKSLPPLDFKTTHTSKLCCPGGNVGANATRQPSPRHVREVAATLFNLAIRALQKICGAEDTRELGVI